MDMVEEMASIDDDYSWHPPSESELKVIEARRERSNKISSLIGQYLLKGYKMLATVCPTCDCVLLEDRSKIKYCVGCFEVDADTRKDNPAVSEEAARRTVEEIQHRQPTDDTSSFPVVGTTAQQQQAPSPALPNSDTPQTNHAISSTNASLKSKSSSNKNICVHGVDLCEDAKSAVAALQSKLNWATTLLRDTTSIRDAQQIAILIAETCRAISAVKDL